MRTKRRKTKKNGIEIKRHKREEKKKTNIKKKSKI